MEGPFHFVLYPVCHNNSDNLIFMEDHHCKWVDKKLMVEGSFWKLIFWWRQEQQRWTDHHQYHHHPIIIHDIYGSWLAAANFYPLVLFKMMWWIRMLTDCEGLLPFCTRQGSGLYTWRRYDMLIVKWIKLRSPSSFLTEKNNEQYQTRQNDFVEGGGNTTQNPVCLIIIIKQSSKNSPTAFIFIQPITLLQAYKTKHNNFIPHMYVTWEMIILV